MSRSHPAVSVTRTPSTGGTGSATALPPEPRASQRLRIELRICALIGLCWILSLVHAGLWCWLSLSARELEALGWGRVLVPMLLALAVILMTVVRALPELRWPRGETQQAAPLGAWLLLGGFPGLIAAPILFPRDRQQRRRPQASGEEIELAFRVMVEAPRRIGGSFAFWMAIAMIAATVTVVEGTGWSMLSVAALLAANLSLLAPVAAIVASRVRAMLRPELLSAQRPRAHEEVAPDRGGLRRELATAAAICVSGAALAPLLGAWIFLETTMPRALEGVAQQRAAALLDASIRGRIGEVAAIQASAPDAEIVERGGRTRGKLPFAALTTGPRDENGDGLVDAWVETSPELAVIMPTHRYDRAPFLPIALLGACLIGLGVAASWIVTRDFERDLGRASTMIAAIASQRTPPRVVEGSIYTREVRRLVAAIGRLLARISEINVAKYVAIERSQEADRLKSQFLANMSHDLRSPLNSILGFSDLLLSGIDGEINEDARELLTIIQASGKDLLQQIDEILDTAKIEAGRMEMQIEPTPPSTLISKALTAARVRCNPDITFDSAVAAGLPPAFVDPYRAAQAIEHVVVFASEGIQTPVLKISCALEDDGASPPMLRFEISSDAAPPDEEQLEAVLGGFHRTPGHRGLGLGLPLAGSICELLGGSLGVEGEHTSRYVIHLPVPQARSTLKFRPLVRGKS